MRTGVLSDIEIKRHCPEFFPLDLGTATALQKVNLQKNVFKGIKNSKNMKIGVDNPRFPINDLHNFSEFGVPSKPEEAEFYSIMNYRKNLNSHNVPDDLNQAYQNRVDSTNTINGLLTHNNVNLNTEPHVHIYENTSSLHLNMLKPKTGTDAFSQSVKGSREYYDAQTRTMLGRITESGDYNKIHKLINPFNVPLNHKQVLESLNHEYRSDTTSLNSIEKAHHESSQHHNLSGLNVHDFRDDDFISIDN